MCGIVGYIGQRRAEDVLLDGLRRLEYRGYDSSGVATLHEGEIVVVKAAGKVAMLEDVLFRTPAAGSVGIAHTRWATHGEPSDLNAHPHVDCRGTIALVHNGIIENYVALREVLTKRGHEIRTATDSEVLAHLIEDHAGQLPFEEALVAALKEVVGTFGLAVVNAAEPRRIYAARRGSPLVLGFGKNLDEFFIASDPAALVSYTRDLIFLDDNEYAVVDGNGIETKNFDRVKKTKMIESLDWSVDEIERGNFPHFMLKEIHEQPSVIVNVARGRLDHEQGGVILGGLRDMEKQVRDIRRLTIVGCGTALLAGRIGELMLEEYAEIPTRAEIASEFRYRKAIFEPRSEAVIAVSQSGETADTIGAVKEAKRRGAMTFGIVNVVGSTIARETDAGMFTYCGPEIAVASTKAFTAQVAAFALLSVYLGRQRGMSLATGQRIIDEIELLPGKIEKVLAQADHIKAIARKYAYHSSMLYIGRKYSAPVAVEGALKLKETSYIHAEGYAAGEMKHGPIALLEHSFPVLAIAPKDSVYEKTVSSIEEVRARHAPVIAVTTDGCEEILRLSDDVIFVPRTLEMLSPILTVLPLQLFAYYMAVERGLDPDKPRNLAKSVTVD